MWHSYFSVLFAQRTWPIEINLDSECMLQKYHAILNQNKANILSFCIEIRQNPEYKK